MSQFLHYEEVEAHLSALPDDVLERLAAGPTDDLPDDRADRDGEPCRVCDILAPQDGYMEHGRESRHLPYRIRLHGRALWVWHEPKVEDLAEYAEYVDPTQELGNGFNLADRPLERAVFAAMMGAASYARCCLIYALAEKHLMIRRDR